MADKSDENQKCHLIEGDYSAFDGGDEFDLIENVIKSSHFNMAILKCRSCEQHYIHCILEYTTADWEDYLWDAWIPMTVMGIKDLKESNKLIDDLMNIIDKSPLICCDPEKKTYWCSSGNPLISLVLRQAL
jgi:hypothetical protein